MYRMLFYDHKNKMLLIACFVLLAVIADTHGEPFGGYYGSSLNVNGYQRDHGGEILSPKCPRLCTCTGHTVDCSHRGLSSVPRKIPLETERLWVKFFNIFLRKFCHLSTVISHSLMIYVYCHFCDIKFA